MFYKRIRKLEERIQQLESIVAHVRIIPPIEEMFEALGEREHMMSNNTKEFLYSLYESYEEYGRLTGTQHECLVRNYNKFIRGIKF